jgi:hypothetical protein
VAEIATDAPAEGSKKAEKLKAAIAKNEARAAARLVKEEKQAAPKAKAKAEAKAGGDGDGKTKKEGEGKAKKDKAKPAADGTKAGKKKE